MRRAFHLVAVLAILGLCMPAFAAEHGGGGGAENAIGYGGAKVQLQPFMVPYKSGSGIQYQVVTLRLVLDVGLMERAGCFMAPIVHEKLLLCLHKLKPTPADFVGQRKEVMQKEMLDVAIAATDRGIYSAVEVVDEAMLQVKDEKTGTHMDPKSTTLTSQCK